VKNRVHGLRLGWLVICSFNGLVNTPELMLIPYCKQV
jgi:hypothetical protein